MTPDSRAVALTVAILLACASPGRAEGPGPDDAADLRRSLEVGGDVEFAAIAVNAQRKPGGNETSFGDFAGVLTVRARLERALPRHFEAAGLDAAWIPGQGALDFADPARRNENNQNWLRADGTFNAPELTANLWARWRLGSGSTLRLRLGGFLASGLEAMDGAPSVHYLTLPAPLIHAQHWDKGLEARWRRGDALEIRAALLDGDWAVGEPSLMRLHNSAANSYPSYAAAASLRVLAWGRAGGTARTSGGLTVGGDGTWGQLGSTWPPGNLYEKRRQNNMTWYATVRQPTPGGGLEVRAFHVRLERNPLGTGSGSRDPAVRTTGDGVEVGYRGLALAGADVDLYAHAWRLRNPSGVADGEVWPGENGLHATSVRGWLVGARWDDPIRTGGATRSYIGVAWGAIRPDVPDAFGSSRHLRALFRLVAGLRR